MEKLKHDNKILAELDQEVKKFSTNQTTSISTVLSSSLPISITAQNGSLSLINQGKMRMS